MAQNNIFIFCFLFARCNQVKRYVVTFYKCLKKQVYRYSNHLMHSFLLHFQIGGLWELRVSATDICNERFGRCLFDRYLPLYHRAVSIPNPKRNRHYKPGGGRHPPGMWGRRAASREWWPSQSGVPLNGPVPC